MFVKVLNLMNYLSSNESFINAISKLFEKCIEYEIVPHIWKAAIVIPLDKKCSIHIKRNYSYLPNPSARAGYDTRSIFKRSLTGLNSEFSFS